MSNKKRSKNSRNTRHQQDTATRKQVEARKRQKSRKQKMPSQNKLLMLVGLVILCVGIIAPEILSLLGPRIAVIVKWLAVIAIILAIVATRYNMTGSECVGWLVDKLLNRDNDDYEDEDDEEWDDEEDWDDFDDEEDDIVEEPKPAVRRRAPAEPAPVVEEARVPECNKEDFELFMQFMAFREAQKKAPPAKAEPAPKTSKK